MNPYQVLNIPENSSLEDVERAYRKLALQFHPDRNIGDENAAIKFREVQEAYDRIKKPESFATHHHHGSPFGENDFNVIFPFFNEDPNLAMVLQINLKDAYFGCEKAIYIPRKVSCDHCGGTKFSKTENCQTCKGVGRLQRGHMLFPCLQCQGVGKIGIDKCGFCHFTGYKKTNTEIVAKIPAGIRDGLILRLQNAGHRFSGFVGDLLLQVKILPYEKYYLMNDELNIDLELPFSTFVAGGDVEIKCLDDETVVVKIPPKTPDGTKLRVKNKGMPTPNSTNKGDLVAKLSVYIPDITDIKIINQLKLLSV